MNPYLSFSGEPGTASPAKTKTAAAPLIAPVTVDRPWQNQFPARADWITAFGLTATNLFLWNESADTRLRSFAGTAIYKTTVNMRRIG